MATVVGLVLLLACSYLGAASAGGAPLRVAAGTSWSGGKLCLSTGASSSSRCASSRSGTDVPEPQRRPERRGSLR